MTDLPLFSQLRVPGRQSDPAGLQALRRLILRARELAGLDGLMLWADGGLPLYRSLAGICRECGVAPYLWFAVLADVQALSFAEGDLQLRADGGRGHGRIGAWEGLGTGGEDFLFLCPNRKEPLERVFQSFLDLLEQADFAGVMLDRIRYPSAVNGYESLFGCFCPDCEREFAALYGSGLDAERRRASALLSSLSSGRPPSARSFAELWREAGLERLFDFKNRSITRVVRRFAEAARRRGLEVGLDLYTYSLAPLVGQDYGQLSACADWLKPMSYCHAVGPAGLPLEVACLQDGLARLCPRLPAGEAQRWLQDLLGWRWPEGREVLLAEGLAEATLGIEMERIAADCCLGLARVLAGFEAVRLSELGVRISAEVLRRYLEQAAPPRAGGWVASWNLAHIPEENLRVLGGRKGPG